MSLPDTIFILLGALILFGPKKLPEIARQAGKLLGELRRASNEFKFQMEEELRLADDAERRRKAEANAGTAAAAPASLMTPLPQPPNPPSGPRPPETGPPIARSDDVVVQQDGFVSDPQPPEVTANPEPAIVAGPAPQAVSHG